MFEELAGKIITKAIDGSINILASAVKRKNDDLLLRNEKIKAPPRTIKAHVKSTKPILVDSLINHINDIKSWSQQIRFSDLQGFKLVSQVHVELDTYLMPLNLHENKKERKNIKPLSDAIRDSKQHCAILGAAGAGKTTSLQKICIDFFKIGKVFGTKNFPILIRLREQKFDGDKKPISSALAHILSISIDFEGTVTKKDSALIAEIESSILLNYIDGLNATILIDGFDELSSDSVKDAVISDLSRICEQLKNTKVIITSRSSEFKYCISSLDRFEIASLTSDQIKLFAERWLQSKEKATIFLQKVYSSPFADTAIRPLTIAHLCAIYERIEDIPDKPKSVYKRIIQLLLEDWNSQRHIKKTSAYAAFDTDRKQDFLSHLAYYLTAELEELHFSSSTLREAYTRIYQDHGLPPKQAQQVVSELESHTGLIIESVRGNYEFAHKSLQEYLAADYIIRLPSLSSISSKFSLLANELAIATSLSSKPAEYLVELFLRAIDVDRDEVHWIPTFISRLTQEKPELGRGISEYSAVASIYLMSRADFNEDVIDFLRPALPDNALPLLQRHYLLYEQDDQLTYLQRSSISLEHSFPFKLSVPTYLLSNGSGK